MNDIYKISLVIPNQYIRFKEVLKSVTGQMVGTGVGRNNKKIFKRMGLSLLVLLTICGITAAIYVYTQLHKISPSKIDKSPEELGISSSLLARVDSLKEPPVNIALFGLDKRPTDKYGNSDAIIILSIDKAGQSIKLSSIMRDTYVKIDSVGMDKINASYRIGGPQLAVKTINQNFKLNIEDFVSVDFDGMANVIDALGGISLDVKKKEVRWLNSYLYVNAGDTNMKQPYVTKSGLQLLNGKQAVAYTRIRYVGNDYERTQRQRTVLRLLLAKMKQEGGSGYTTVITKILPFVETNMSHFALLKLGASVFINNIRTLEERRFPLPEESKGKIIEGVWYLITDIDATSKSLTNFIFNDRPKITH